MKTYAIVNNDYDHRALIAAILSRKNTASLAARLSIFLSTRECFFTNQGLTALFVLLKTYQELHPDRNEVIIPAYTAPALVLPIHMLGLTPVLCDVEPKGFLLDIRQALRLCGNKTLAIVPVHMFGIPVNMPELIAGVDKDIFIIEDCAQSLGTELDNKKMGTFAPVSFGSFSRGKNFSLYYGGFLSLNSAELHAPVVRNLELLAQDSSFAGRKALLQHTAFSFISEPLLYSLAARPLSLLQSKTERASFSTRRISPSLFSFATKLFDAWKTHYHKRIENGHILAQALKDLSGLIAPYYPANACIAFNRFPVIVEDPVQKSRLYQKLHDNGIMASFMYNRPLHHCFDLGYQPNELPNAVFLSKHLLTLPVHGLCDRKSLDKTINIVYDMFK